MAIIGLLPALAPIAKVYLQLAVPLTNIATALLNITGAIINLPGIGKIIAYGAAFQILAGRMLGVNLAMLALNGIVQIVTATFGAFDIAVDANVISIIIIAIIALIVIVALLITHWKEVTKVVQQVWKDVTTWVGKLVADIGKWFSALGTMVSKAWSAFASQPGYWVGYMIGFVMGKMFVLEKQFGAWFATNISNIIRWGTSMAQAAPGAISTFAASVMKEANKLPGKFVSLGGDIVTGLISGIKNMAPWALNQLSGFFTGLVNGARSAIRSGSPSKVFAEIGASIPQGVGLGVNQNTMVAMAALSSMFNQLTNHGQGLARGNFGGAGLAIAGGGRLGGPISINAPISVTVSGSSSATPQGIGSAVQQAVQKEFDALVQHLIGGSYSTPGS
jgi:hypothetical protein